MVPIVALLSALVLTSNAAKNKAQASAAPAAAPAAASCDGVCEATYKDFVLAVCGHDAVDDGCKDAYGKGLGGFEYRLGRVCDYSGDLNQEQLDTLGRRCPQTRAVMTEEGGVASFPTQAQWAQEAKGPDFKGDFEKLRDRKKLIFFGYKNGYNRASALYQHLAQDGYTSKDFRSELKRDSGIGAPDVRTGKVSKLSVDDAVYLYLGDGAENFLIGKEGGKGGKYAYLKQLESKDGEKAVPGTDADRQHLRELYLDKQAQSMVFGSDKLKDNLKKADKKTKDEMKKLEAGKEQVADESVLSVAGGSQEWQKAVQHPAYQSAAEYKAYVSKLDAQEKLRKAATAPKIDEKVVPPPDIQMPVTTTLPNLPAVTPKIPPPPLSPKASADLERASKQKPSAWSSADLRAAKKDLDTDAQMLTPEQKKTLGEIDSVLARRGRGGPVAMTYDPNSTSGWQATVAGQAVSVTEYRSVGGLNRITFSQPGSSNGYASYVAVDGKHPLQPVANDPAHWQVQPGSELEVKSASGAPQIWRLSSKTKAGVLIPKDQVLSDADLRKLGLVKVEASIAPKRLVPVAMGSMTEYKQADNGDIMGVAWTPAGGKDGGSYAQVRGGKGVKLEPTATSYLVKGPATLILKSPNADVKTISIPAGKVIEIDRNTKTAKDAVDASQAQKPSPAHASLPAVTNGFDISSRCSGPECLDNK